LIPKELGIIPFVGSDEEKKPRQTNFQCPYCHRIYRIQLTLLKESDWTAEEIKERPRNKR
jgi:hypothetical protein